MKEIIIAPKKGSGKLCRSRGKFSINRGNLRKYLPQKVDIKMGKRFRFNNECTLTGDRKYPWDLIINGRGIIGLNISREVPSHQNNFRQCDLKEMNLNLKIYWYKAKRPPSWIGAEMINLPDIITGENPVIAAGSSLYEIHRWGSLAFWVIV